MLLDIKAGSAMVPVPGRVMENEQAFSRRRVQFLSLLSKAIFLDQEARNYPDLITFSYFIRHKNVSTYIDKHSSDPGGALVGVGIAVHIAPSNIPLNWAYSWVYSFIAGCSSFIRLPSQEAPQSKILLNHIQNLFLSSEFDDLSLANLFFRSEKDSAQLLDLLASADAVLVWGGDRTIAAIRNRSLKPSARLVPFPDRKSTLLVKSSELLTRWSEETKFSVGMALFNDTYLVDANACSSPSQWIFIGSEDENRLAQTYLAEALDKYIDGKKYAPPAIARLLDSFPSSGDHATGYAMENLGLYSKAVIASELSSQRNLRFGVFRLFNVFSISEIPEFLRTNEQTITYYGLNHGEIFQVRDLCAVWSVPITRIVPMGAAIELDFVWEGQDIPILLTRRITVK